LGSKDHVKQALSTTVVGERLQDYLINLNYDMLGSPNYMFGIYDGKTANNDTPAEAVPGSNKVTAAFVEWFKANQLPWTYTEFSGRSDYGPFLEKGIVASGLFSGGDGTKTKEERDYYDRMLGSGMGGISGITHDPCYHQACDSIENINVFAVEKMIQAAAHMLEFLARQDDLEAWLYPNGRPPIPKSSVFRPKLNLKNKRSGPPIF
jgi:Zn-dependent M28 family amino/carboxypeptidase